MFIPGDDENTQPDANSTEASSAPESNESQTLDTSAPEGEASHEQSQVPFHEHPRFKELIDYRRQAEERFSTYERQMQEMQRQYQEALAQRQQAQKPVNPLVSKFKEIDPEYGKTMEEIYERAQSVEEVRKELAELRRERMVAQYESTVEKLHNDNKVDPSIRNFVKKQLDALAFSGQIRDLKDVPNAYKAIADEYTKLIEGVKRSTTAGYVQDKSKDAKSPQSQPKGKIPPRNEKGQFTGDRETDLAMIARRAVKLSKAGGDL